ncbi:hypothetical protein DYB28_012303 [Aphanomyces astaci]|uniref:CCHC-type domain-containing protein n=1 Tax=Aphanomyces astaci TaxID=112090 RepID=A0A9X8DYU4_APHAT|nr:hypothetical protein DYB28_012303 [Aphanomyces astaci]
MPLRPPMVRNPVVEVYSPGAATGVVTQVERILPHLLEVDLVGVTMVDLSGAEVTLRDLLVVEDLDMEDPAGTTVVLLALREADPEETALVPDSPTHPWSPVRLHLRSCPMLGWRSLISSKRSTGSTTPRSFDDRLTSNRKVAEITDSSHRKSTETVREYAWRIADASREAGLQANRAVVIMINGYSDAEVVVCLRGASVRPETIEISLDYLIERDVDIDRRTDGSRSPPRTTPVAPSTPTRSARNTSRTQSSSTPNRNLQELQASISRLQRDMTSLTTSNNDQFSSIQDVVAMISTDNPAGNNPVQPRICMDPDDETKSGEVICGRCTMRGHSREQCPRLSWFCTRCRSKGHGLSECSLSRDNGGRGPGQTRTGPGGRGGNATCYTCGKMGHLSWGCPLNASKQSTMPAHVVAALQS